MSITVTRARHADTPHLTCAWCRQPITDVRIANLLWNGDELTSDDDITTAVVAHKGACTLRLDSKHGTTLYSTELAVAIYQLMANMQMSAADLERARVTHKRLAQLAINE